MAAEAWVELETLAPEQASPPAAASMLDHKSLSRAVSGAAGAGRAAAWGAPAGQPAPAPATVTKAEAASGPSARAPVVAAAPPAPLGKPTAAPGADREARNAVGLAAADDQGEGGALARRTTVRHYTQMNPGRTYPLLVIISAGKVERVVLQEVAQVESETGFTVSRESPMVRIEPVLPGCAVAPAAIDIDCTAAVAEAKFHVTPIIEGDLAEARIEVRHEGRVIDIVPIPTRVAKQTMAKISATFSAVAPIATKILHLANRGGGAGEDDVVGRAAALLADLEKAVGGPAAFAVAVALVGAFFALVFYVRNRAREGDPIVRFLDYAAALPAEEDLSVVRLKARIAVLVHDARLLVPIRKRRTTLGKDPACDIVVKDGSVHGRHAEIIFDGERLRIRSLGGAPLLVEDQPAVQGDLRGDEVALRLAKAPLLYFREARDDDLDSEGSRERLVDALVARLPMFEAEVRAAFADPSRPSRACGADLMAKGRLDLPTWREVLRGLKPP
jgi:hypothetical protein